MNEVIEKSSSAWRFSAEGPEEFERFLEEMSIAVTGLGNFLTDLTILQKSIAIPDESLSFLAHAAELLGEELEKGKEWYASQQSREGSKGDDEEEQ